MERKFMNRKSKARIGVENDGELRQSCSACYDT